MFKYLFYLVLLINSNILNAQIDTAIQLSDDGKTQIGLEEKYRHDFNQKLNSKSKEENKILDFLNSPLGLWLLTSVLLGAISFVWSEYQKKREKAKANSGKIVELEAKFLHNLVITRYKTYPAVLRLLGTIRDLSLIHI